MCKLCEYAGASSAFRSGMMKATVRDIDRIVKTRSRVPDNPSVFSNLPSWAATRFDFALFEVLGAFPNPTAYYQALHVDGQKVRTDWQNDWVRSIGFLPNGNILLFTKATGHERGNPARELFFYFFMVEFTPAELKFECRPPQFIIRADDVKKEGVNLLTNAPASHTFSFTFAHMAAETSAMRADAVNESAFLRQVLRIKPTDKNKSAPGSLDAPGAPTTPTSDFEKFVVTTPHYAPHPLLMNGYREMGYENRFAMQIDVPNLLSGHFNQLMKKA